VFKLPRVFLRLGELSPRRILDVGAGHGEKAYFLSQSGHSVVAIEIDLFKALRLRSLGVEVVVADAHHLPFRQRAFEVVLLWNVLMFLREPRRAVFEAVRAARPGALVFVSIYAVATGRNFSNGELLGLLSPLCTPRFVIHNSPAQFSLICTANSVGQSDVYVLKASEAVELLRGLDPDSRVIVMVDGREPMCNSYPLTPVYIQSLDKLNKVLELFAGRTVLSGDAVYAALRRIVNRREDAVKIANDLARFGVFRAKPKALVGFEDYRPCIGRRVFISELAQPPVTAETLLFLHATGNPYFRLLLRLGEESLELAKHELAKAIEERGYRDPLLLRRIFGIYRGVVEISGDKLVIANLSPLALLKTA